MDTLFILLFFVFGITFGSFFNVVGLRVPKGETFANDRSYCPTCKNQLKWYELIPVFSFLIQGGKCRNCKSKISYMYPVVELLTGLLFVYSYMQIGWEIELITALLLVSMLMIILVSDLTYMLIPNKVLFFFLPFFMVVRMIQPLDPWWSSAVGAFVGFIMIAVIILVSKGGMGGGDLKLFVLLGVVLGTGKLLLTFFLACLIGAVIGGLLMLFKLVNHRQPIAFGPYIIMAALIAYFYGDGLIGWYLGFM